MQNIAVGLYHTDSIYKGLAAVTIENSRSGRKGCLAVTTYYNSSCHPPSARVSLNSRVESHRDCALIVVLPSSDDQRSCCDRKIPTQDLNNIHSSYQE
jgi:hypothetical protein